jgi:heat shock protein HtpX
MGPGTLIGVRRILAYAVAAVVHVLSIGCLALGAWLCTRDFPAVWLLPGVVLLVLGALTMPRPPGMPKHTVQLSGVEAPELCALVERVRIALGVRRLRVVAADDRFDAASGVAGLLRRPYLVIGAPLWASLDARGRVALLALELGRFAPGDPSRSPVTGWVDHSFAELEGLLEPQRDKSLRALQDPVVVGAMSSRVGSQVSGDQSLVWIVELLLFPVMWVLRGAVAMLRRTYLALLRPDAIRAVYAADATAARVAGSTAVAEVLLTRWLMPSIVTVLRRDARAGDHAGPAAWALRRAPVLPHVAAWPALAAEVRATHPVAPAAGDGDAGEYPPSLGQRVAALPPDEPGELHLAASGTDAELEPLYRRIVSDLRAG